mmetsp:Transcript_13061/g.37624  ORF Transcript_13061/g.37624 Transcript_13061/m.37624 type:complete len:237 (+) Transcript_13061:2808-3518(+)
MAGLGVSPGTSPGVSRPGRSQSRPDGAFRKDRRSLLCTLSTASLLLAFPLPSEALSRAQQKAYDAFVVAPPQPVTSAQVQKQREDRVRQSFQVEEGRIQVALRLYTDAVQDQREGRYQEALSKYEQIIRNYGDFALAERSRVSRAILEYQLGSVDAAILHLKDEEVALRGDAEVHCALAVVLYAEKPYELSQAEEQFEIAMEFDKRFMDASYVRDGKPAWPPRMVLALEKFRSFGR